MIDSNFSFEDNLSDSNRNRVAASGSEKAKRGHCGFTMELPEEWEAGHDEWYSATKAVCCWRPVWNNTDRCIWHADVEIEEDGNNSIDELRE